MPWEKSFLNQKLLVQVAVTESSRPCRLTHAFTSMSVRHAKRCLSLIKAIVVCFVLLARLSARLFNRAITVVIDPRFVKVCIDVCPFNFPTDESCKADFR